MNAPLRTFVGATIASLLACSPGASPQADGPSCEAWCTLVRQAVAEVDGGDAGGLDVDYACWTLRPLPRDASGRVACHVLAALDHRAACATVPGMSDVAPAVSARFARAVPFDLEAHPVCELAQLAPDTSGSCATSSAAGWCYVTGDLAGACPSTMAFSASALPVSALFLVTCDESPTPTGCACF